MSKPFVMPPTYLGQVVRWKPHPGSDAGSPAFIVAIGTNNVGLLVFHPRTVNGLPYDGVIHESDPKFEPARYGEFGVWGYVEDQDDYIMYQVANESAKQANRKTGSHSV